MQTGLFTVLMAFSMYATSQTYQTNMKTIEVTGSSDRYITPDEVIFSIAIEEYWEEEFQGKKYEEYRTKVEIETIEAALMKELHAVGIEMNDITLKNAGNYYRQRGKDFLVHKNIDISLSSFEKGNDLANRLKTRGIRSMTVGKMKHKDMELIKSEVQAEALQAARRKAEFLAAVVGKKVKDVLTIVEIDRNVGSIPRPQAYARGAAMMMAEDTSSGGAQYEHFQKIHINAQVRVLWEVE